MTLSSRQIRFIAIFAGVNLLVVAVGWMALVSPQRHDAAKAAAAAKVAQDEFSTLMGQGSTGPVKQPDIHSAGIYTLDTALPSQADEPTLLLELDRLGKASGVKITGVSPEAAQATASGYTILPINVQLDGSYYHVTEFLRNLRELVSEQHGHLIARGPLFAVNNVALADAGGADTPATVQIQAYYYGVTAGATPPASTTDTTTTTGG
jgi:hypothetical protein